MASGSRAALAFQTELDDVKKAAEESESKIKERIAELEASAESLEATGTEDTAPELSIRQHYDATILQYRDGDGEVHSVRFVDVHSLVESEVMQFDFWCQLPGEEEWKTLDDLMENEGFLEAVGL